MTKLVRSAAVIAFIIVSGFTAGAQPNNPAVEDPDQVPFTGLEYLLISGGIYGGLRLFKKADKKMKA